jgi:hypothetical protein
MQDKLEVLKDILQAAHTGLAYHGDARLKSTKEVLIHTVNAIEAVAAEVVKIQADVAALKQSPVAAKTTK